METRSGQLWPETLLPIGSDETRHQLGSGTHIVPRPQGREGILSQVAGVDEVVEETARHTGNESQAPHLVGASQLPKPGSDYVLVEPEIVVGRLETMHENVEVEEDASHLAPRGKSTRAALLKEQRDPPLEVVMKR